MGQYYRAYIQTLGREPRIYTMEPDVFMKTENYDFYNGLKLMEHSWLQNSLLTDVCNEIYHRPSLVAWVGDYCTDDATPDLLFKLAWGDESPKIDYEVYSEWIKTATWNDEEYQYIDHKFDYADRWLVNHTKRIAFKFDNLYKDEDGWTIHPLPLLTCTANHSGGSYYGDEKADNELVGTWYLNVISIEEELPKGYVEVETPQFFERR